jgi:DNA-binding XRE family transcriptional regulator
LTLDGHLTQNGGMTQQPDASSPALVPEWTLGWRLQRALAHAGLTSNEIADDMEVSRTTISRWLNDRGAPPRTIYVRQWALRTGVPYPWLATGEAGNPKNNGTTAPLASHDASLNIPGCTGPLELAA